MTRCFLDVNIGDPEANAAEVAAYERGQAFAEEVAKQYALPEGSSEYLLEAYAADPTWVARGPARLDAPPPILAGRLVVELDEEAAPKAAENFRCLCTGEKGKGKASGKPLHYTGAPIHRIISGFVAQGGDIVRGDGSGGDSIYGKPFQDDRGGLRKKHDARGILSMANSGKNSNTSQFFITFGPAKALDGRHVIFGRVVQGMEVIDRIEKEAASPDGIPRVPVSVAACGQLD